jgi:NADH-quinone oxidoreductase subunit J
MIVSTSLCVVFVKHTVQSALWLIVTFIICSALWMMLQAEFLALALIFVYVGAVLTLFLFVIMMINTDKEEHINPVKRAVPFAVLLMLLLFAVLAGAIYHYNHHWIHASLVHYSTTYSNTKSMGDILYTHYYLAFEMAALVLLVAIIGAISLAFFGSDMQEHKKVIKKQREASKENGLRIIDIPSEGRS